MKIFIPLILAFNISISYTRYIETKINVFFTQTNNCREEILKNIEEAKYSIIFAVYFFSDKEIAEALLQASKRGIRIEGVIDKQSFYGKNRKFLNSLKKELNIKVIKKQHGIMHHKFAVIDQKVVLTGSYNWTFSANNKNNENLVIIKNEDIALKYLKEYKRILFNNFK